MPSDEDSSPAAENAAAPSTGHRQRVLLSATTSYRSIFQLPSSVKCVFDKFPLVTYEENSLPLRAPKHQQEHVLHVFTTEAGARAGNLSFNPACLKWQAYLRFNDIKFRTVPSNNHASPSGALPFLQPAATMQHKAQAPIPSNKLKKWLASQRDTSTAAEPDDLRYEAYISLLEDPIRKAWLFQLYLEPGNVLLLSQLYVDTCSSHPIVNATLAYQLRIAAEGELKKASASLVLIEPDIMHDAAEAFEALSSLLGEDEWFFGCSSAGLFDASVLAYTHLILCGDLKWRHNKLATALREHSNLVHHQKRAVQQYF